MMRLYKYVARDDTGAKHTGEIRAASKFAVSASLKEKKLVAVSIELQSIWRCSWNRVQQFVWWLFPVSRNTRLMLLFEMSILLKNKMSLQDALLHMSEQMPSKRIKMVLEQIHERLAKGVPLVESFEGFEQVFSEHVINYLGASKKGISLEKIFGLLYDLQNSLQHQSMFREYILPNFPLIVTIFISLAFINLLVYQDVAFMLQELKALQVNIPTSLLVKANFAVSIAHHWLEIVICFFLVLLGLRILFKAGWFITHWHQLIVKIPIIRRGVLLSDTYNFLVVASVGRDFGLTVSQVLSVGGSLMRNRLLRKEAQDAAKQLNLGVGLNSVLKNMSLFSLLEKHMLINSVERPGGFRKVTLLLKSVYSARIKMQAVFGRQVVRVILFVVLAVAWSVFLWIFGSLLQLRGGY